MTPPASELGWSKPRTRTPTKAIGLVTLGAVLALVIGILLLADGSEEDDGSEVTGEPAITLSPASGPPGTEVSVSGEGFDGGETVYFSAGGNVFAEVTADGDGAFSATFPVDPETETGQYEIEATGADGGPSASATFAVS